MCLKLWDPTSHQPVFNLPDSPIRRASGKQNITNFNSPDEGSAAMFLLANSCAIKANFTGLLLSEGALQ
jgi:hypothetical protein